MASLAEKRIADAEEGSMDPQARPEELRLLEALLFASAEPLDQATLAKRMPEGVDVKVALSQHRMTAPDAFENTTARTLLSGSVPYLLHAPVPARPRSWRQTRWPAGRDPRRSSSGTRRGSSSPRRSRPDAPARPSPPPATRLCVWQGARW